ncbi:MAG: AMP-binding protein [Pseudomonadota bacterium]
MDYFDDLEVRSDDERTRALKLDLPNQIARAQATTGGMAQLAGVDADLISTREELASLPVLRKSVLVAAQELDPPFGGFTAYPVAHYTNVYQSPGPIYEPGMDSPDWWRLGRFLHASGVGKGDVVQNCFSYHLTPAGLMFESAARAVSAAVLPAGVGQTELQVQAASRIGVTAYAGTPDYLKVILEAADESGHDLSRITRATVGGGALFPSLRDYYKDRGISCRQCYATADLGNIAYETDALDGMIIDEGVLVEIVQPGTGDPLPDGEVGEVIVTTLNRDYPLVRFATGDLSAILPGKSPCGRTNQRIKGWMGRADQTTKIKGMFVRPEQVASLIKACPGIRKVRVTVTRESEQDVMRVQFEGEPQNLDSLQSAVKAHLKLLADVSMCEPGTLPNDGKVIDDQRTYDS